MQIDWPLRLLSMLILGSSGPALAQTMSIPVPKSVISGVCRPVNVSATEIGSQWNLYYSHATALTRDSEQERAERGGLRQNNIEAELIECYKGSELFHLVCFTKGHAGRFSLKMIKLVHSPTRNDCLTISNISKQ